MRMQSLLEIIGAGALLPAAVSGVLLVLAVRRNGRWAALRPLAASVGFFAGYAALTWAWRPIDPTNPWHWLPGLALAAAAAEILRRKTQIAARAGLGILAGFVLTDADVPARLLTIGCVAVGILAVWTVLDRRTALSPGPLVPLLLLAVSAAGSAVLMLAGNAKLAQLGGVLAAVQGAAMLVAWRYPASSVPRDAVPCFGVVLFGLLLQGHLNNYTDVSLASFLLVAFSPLALFAGLLKPLRDSKRRPIIEAGGVLALLGLALVLALVQGGLPVE